MSRIGLGIALFICAGACQAQAPGQQLVRRFPSATAPGTDADVRAKRADPSAVMVPLYAGAPVREVIDALNAKGFLIKYDPEQVLPTMKLLEKPKATRIDTLLSEILTPYELKADHNLMDGGWRVRPVKKKKKEVVVEDPEPPAVATPPAK